MPICTACRRASEKTGEPKLVDQDGVPIEPDDQGVAAVLRVCAVSAGDRRRDSASGRRAELDEFRPRRMATARRSGTAFAGHGGDLAKYLYPHVIAEEKKINPNVVATEAGVGCRRRCIMEGGKVQTDWLHDFLMDPTSIRPAVVLRMPNFHMSSDEASKLVDYFAAKSNAEFPYEYNDAPPTAATSAELEQAHPELLGRCDEDRHGRQLLREVPLGGRLPGRRARRRRWVRIWTEVYRRLRPDYVRRWVGNPQRILPYTGMPVNIPYDPNAPHFGGVNQALFPGPSIEQLDGVVDLLMNFDEYHKRQTSVKGLVKEPALAPATGQVGRCFAAARRSSGQASRSCCSVRRSVPTLPNREANHHESAIATNILILAATGRDCRWLERRRRRPPAGARSRASS